MGKIKKIMLEDGIHWFDENSAEAISVRKYRASYLLTDYLIKTRKGTIIFKQNESTNYTYTYRIASQQDIDMFALGEENEV